MEHFVTNSAEFEVTEFERSVEKQDKANRRMTVDPNDLLDLDLDDDEGEEAANDDNGHDDDGDEDASPQSDRGANLPIDPCAIVRCDCLVHRVGVCRLNCWCRPVVLGLGLGLG